MFGYAQVFTFHVRKEKAPSGCRVHVVARSVKARREAGTAASDEHMILGIHNCGPALPACFLHVRNALPDVFIPMTGLAGGVGVTVAMTPYFRLLPWSRGWTDRTRPQE
jgi:hypothetical protein